MARPAASSRSMRRRSPISPPRRAAPRGSRSSRNTPRRRASSARATAADPGLHRDARSRSCDRRALDRRPEAARGPHRARGRRQRLQDRARNRISGRPATRRRATRSKARISTLGHGDVVIAAITSCTNTSNPSVLIGAGLLARNAVAKGLTVEALGQDFAGAGEPGRRRISRQFRPAEIARQARLQSGRLRLHDLHRQFRSARAGNLEDRSMTTGSSPRRCCPAIAISRAASAPTCRPIISPRRRSSSPMRSPARWRRISTTEPLGHDKKGNPVFLARHLAVG